MKKIATRFLLTAEITPLIRFQRITLRSPDGTQVIAPAVGWWKGLMYFVFPDGWKDVERHMLAGWRPT